MPDHILHVVEAQRWIPEHVVDVGSAQGVEVEPAERRFPVDAGLRHIAVDHASRVGRHV